MPARDWREHRPSTVRRSGSPRPEGAAAGLLSSAWRPAALAGFLRLNDPGAQLDRWRTDLDGPALRALMAVALRPGGLLAAFLRRGFPRVIPARFDTVLRQRFAACVARYPNAGNPWLWGLLLGTEPAVAPRPAVEHRVRWERADVAAHLEAVPEGWYDAVTLSNVLDGPPAPYAQRLCRALRHGVRPGGVVVLRSLTDRVPLSGYPATDRCPLWGAVVVSRIGA